MAKKYILQHVGYPVAGRAIRKDEWKTHSLHTTENAAFLEMAAATSHLDYGQWDDHYRVIAPDGVICNIDAWRAMQTERDAMREIKRMSRR